MNHPIPPDLLALLRCPACRQPVDLKEDRLVCRNPACGLRFPVRDGIPVMLLEEAERPPIPATESPPAL